MKTKILLLSVLLTLILAGQHAPAEELNFPAGSLIIPMDEYYQPEVDGGLLEAYGLVYYLLSHQDQTCLTDCITEPFPDACRAACEHDITIYWIINQDKLTIDGADFVIEDLTLAVDENVAALYDHAGGTSALTYNPNLKDPTCMASCAGDTTCEVACPLSPDSHQRITYLGAPWIIHADDVAVARSIIDQAGWSAVNLHVAQVPFKAPVHREMMGTPPYIAVMDSSENGGNAKILQSYLRLAGICTDTYDILSPNDIRDGLLNQEEYDFLWAPHWHGDSSDRNDNLIEDRQEIVNEIAVFLQSGKSLLAECGSITDFENYGLFLTSGGIDKNGGTNDAEDIIYNDLYMPYSQVGDYFFDPTGGSVHNWRPIGGPDTYNDTVTRFAIDNTGWDYYVGGYAFGDRRNGYAVYLGGHSYASCGSLPDEDDPDPNIARLDIEFEQNLFSDVASQNTHEILFEFDKEITDESFTLLVKYDGGLQSSLTFSKENLAVKGGDPLEINLTTAEVNKNKIEHLTFINKKGTTVTIDSITMSWSGGNVDQRFKKIEDKTAGAKPYDQPSVASGVELAVTDFTLEGVATGDEYTLLFSYNEGATTEISFNSTNPSAKNGDPLEVDLTDAYVDGKKLRSLVLRNIGSQLLEVDSVTVSWIGGPVGQTTNRVYDLKTGIKIYDQPKLASGEAPIFLEHIELPPLLASVPSGCVDNGDCNWRNIGAVRYVLNTLFNIKYSIKSREYVRAAPILQHPYLYQGSFEYPSYKGHFRRYDVTAEQGSKAAEWDTADGRIKSPKNGNADFDARQVFTAKYESGTGSKTDFDIFNINELRADLDLTPANGDDSDEFGVIFRLRGYYWDSNLSTWKVLTNRLGGIMHSAPAIVGTKTRVANSRAETAYVGDLFGMLHAVDTASGSEKWAFIPRNLLGRLKNDRTDPNAVQDFAGVDASPTAKDVYYDHDGDGDDEWRTILAGSEGFGGTYIYALDVSDPDNWFPLWEVTDTVAPGGGMGHAYSVAIDKIKNPVRDVDDIDGDFDTDEIIGYEIKWVVFVSTGFAQIAVDHGGINVFAFDLKTGDKLWHFSAEYADSVNDIPGAATVFDLDGDSFVDRVYVGDMNGRMWELDAIDGSNLNGTEGTGEDEKQIPLYNAGIGKPISVSPAILKSGGRTILVFGTGGANWAADDQTYAIYAIDATTKQSVPTYADGAGTLLWKVDLAAGEKVWSTPTVAYGYVFVATAFGSMEGSDPRQDAPVIGQPSGNFLKLKLADGALSWKLTDIGKVRGSIFVDRQHAYMTTIDGQIIQIGGEDFGAGTGSRVVLQTWRQF